ncbi:MAG: N-acetyltransferase [Dehalococcoidales bacterium]|nr:N-acetyltransferase [Dehalococcoidales bacterium]
MNGLAFQEAQEKDLDAMLGVYNFYIATTTATFDIGGISRDEFLQRVFIGHKKYRTFLVLLDGQFAGFCFLSQFNKKKAYDRTACIGAYLKPAFTGKGAGREITAFLEKTARENGIAVLIASISCQNTGSISLCRKMGYEQCACYKEVGEKFGRILDVVEYQKILK